MSRIRHALTDTDVAQLAPQTNGKERTFRQFGVPGLMLRVGRRKRSWEVRIERAPAIRRALGEWPNVKVAAAQDTARTLWERHKTGLPVDAPAKDAETIATVWELRGPDGKVTPGMFQQYLIDENRSPATLAAYRHSFARLSDAIKHKPLQALIDDRDLMANECQRIRKLLANRKRRGQNAAAMTAGFVSALFGYMRDNRGRNLNGDPVSACQTTVPPRDDLPILTVNEMPTWLAGVRKLKNPIVQEALIFTLLTGLRRDSLVTLQWSDLDLKAGCIHVRKAKGEKRFDLILTKPMVGCLWRARKAGRRLFPRQSEWIFAGERGHIRGNSLTKYGVKANHTLRRGYSTAARLAGVDEDVIGKLLNHGGKGLISRYVRTSHLGKMLCGAQRDISAFINKHLNKQSTSAQKPQMIRSELEHSASIV